MTKCNTCGEEAIICTCEEDLFMMINSADEFNKTWFEDEDIELESEPLEAEFFETW